MVRDVGRSFSVIIVSAHREICACGYSDLSRGHPVHKSLGFLLFPRVSVEPFLRKQVYKVHIRLSGCLLPNYSCKRWWRGSRLFLIVSLCVRVVIYTTYLGTRFMGTFSRSIGAHYTMHLRCHTAVNVLITWHHFAKANWRVTLLF